MKKVKMVWMICCILVTSLCITACGNDVEVGNYIVYSVTSDGVELDQDDLKSGVEEVKLTLNKDGTGNLTRGDRSKQLTWGKGMITLEDDTTPYEYKDGILTIFQGDDDKTVFKKQIHNEKK